jgi:hypothetical protein
MRAALESRCEELEWRLEDDRWPLNSPCSNTSWHGLPRALKGKATAQATPCAKEGSYTSLGALHLWYGVQKLV